MFLAMLLTACGGPAPIPLAPTEVVFAESLAVELSSMTLSTTGLYVKVQKEGAGPQAVAGDAMGVSYAVWTADGSKVDASADHRPPKPLKMVLEKTALVAGWTEGVTGMRLGERRQLVVPYELGYGSAGRPPLVPHYATLVFVVELADHTPSK